MAQGKGNIHHFEALWHANVYINIIKVPTLQRHVLTYLYRLVHIPTSVKQILDLLAAVVKQIMAEHGRYRLLQCGSNKSGQS